MPQNPEPEAVDRGDFGESESAATQAWTVSELVSYNLLRARRSRGWTQHELGEAIGRVAGRAWSNASVSAAERAWQGGRPRKFDADEIHAFSVIFDVPFSFFLLPPESDFVILAPLDPDPSGRKFRVGIPPAEYLTRVVAANPRQEFVTRAQELAEGCLGAQYVPARWSEGVEAAVPPGQAEAPARQRKVPAEETVESAEESRARLEKLVEQHGIPTEILDRLVKAKGEELAMAVALELEKQGFLRVPEIEQEISELKETVRRLSASREAKQR